MNLLLILFSAMRKATLRPDPLLTSDAKSSGSRNCARGVMKIREAPAKSPPCWHVTYLVMMWSAYKDDGPFCRDPPCSARLNAAEEDVDDQAPEEQGEIEGDVGGHESVSGESLGDDSSNDAWDELVHRHRERGEEEGKVVDGPGEAWRVARVGPARISRRRASGGRTSYREVWCIGWDVSYVDGRWFLDGRVCLESLGVDRSFGSGAGDWHGGRGGFSRRGRRDGRGVVFVGDGRGRGRNRVRFVNVGRGIGHVLVDATDRGRDAMQSMCRRKFLLPLLAGAFCASVSSDGTSVVVLLSSERDGVEGKIRSLRVRHEEDSRSTTGAGREDMHTSDLLAACVYACSLVGAVIRLSNTPAHITIRHRSKVR